MIRLLTSTPRAFIYRSHAFLLMFIERLPWGEKIFTLRREISVYRFKMRLKSLKNVITILTISQASLFLRVCKSSSLFENTVGKGEIARNEQFLLFPQCFLSFCGDLTAIFIKFNTVVCKLTFEKSKQYRPRKSYQVIIISYF